MRKLSFSTLSCSLALPTALLTMMLAGCAPRATIQTSDSGHESGKTSSGYRPPENANLESAVIFVTSNTDGNLLPSLYSPTGGIAAMKSYFEIEKKELGERVVWLDASHLSAELKSETGVSATLQTPATVLSLGGSGGGFKLGVFALESGSSDLGEAKNLASHLLAEATALRKQGADLVVVLSDLPVVCRPTHGFSTAPGTKPNSKPPLIRKADEPQAYCDGALANALKAIPEGTINAAIVSDAGELQHFVFAQFSSSKTAGIPIIGSAAHGTSGHLLYFSVSKTPNSTNFVPENTRIEGPFPIRTQGKFHGKVVTEDLRIQAVLASAHLERTQEKKEVLAHFNQELGLDPVRESSLADLAADALRAETHADIAIVPLGLFRDAERSKIPTGPFSQADLNRLIPHTTSVATLDVSGEQLRTLLRISESGARGFSGVSGTQLKILKLDQQVPSSDLNGDGHIELWELNRLVSTGSSQDDSESSSNSESGSASNSNGDTSIQSRKIYKLALPLALAQGADDWEWASESMGLAKHASASQDFRGLLADWLKQNPSVNFPAPRLKFVNLQAKSKHKHSRGGKRSKKHGKRRSA